MNRRKIYRILLLLIVWFGIQSPSKLSAQTYVAIDASIYQVDPFTCSSALVFSANFPIWYDIALCSGNPNIIYGLGTSNDLYEINLATNQYILMTSQFNVIFSANHNLNSLVCDGNGTLYAADGGFSDLYSYDIATYTWTHVGGLSGYHSTGDLVFYNGLLYLSTLSGDLITIDPATANVLSAVPLSITGVYGLGVSSTATLCNSGSTSLIGTSGNNLYSVDPATGVCTLTCPNITPLTSSDIGGFASVFEGINPPQTSLQVSATDTSICTGSTTTLMASGGDFYLWQPGNFTTSSITVQPPVTSSYTVIATDSSGCSDTAQITIVVYVPPVFTGTSQMVSCFGACDGSAAVNLVSGSGPFHYWWAPFSATNSTTSSASSLCPGPYNCFITGAGGCMDTVSFFITQPPVLSAVSAHTNVLCNGGNSGSATLTVSGGTPPYTYLWSSGGTAATENNLGAGSYTCTATDANGCIVTQTFLITQPSALMATIFSSPQCGLNNGFASDSVSGGTPGYTYVWSPSGGNFSLATGLASGNYTCTVTDANGCAQIQTVSVVAIPPPTIVISSDTTIIMGASVVLTSAGGINYLWSPSDGLSCTNCQNTVANPMQTTTYCVQVTDTNGCSDSACVRVTVTSDCGEIYIPNAFSPNNDYENDLLCVRGAQCIAYMQFEVFDRWGEMVFTSTDPNNCWDGMLRGQAANVGVYVYYLNATLVNGQQIHKQGNVSLIR